MVVNTSILREHSILGMTLLMCAHLCEFSLKAYEVYFGEFSTKAIRDVQVKTVHAIKLCHTASSHTSFRKLLTWCKYWCHFDFILQVQLT